MRNQRLGGSHGFKSNGNQHQRGDLGTFFSELNQKLFSINDEIIAVLMTLSKNDIKNLQNIPTPRFYEKIFEVANIC